MDLLHGLDEIKKHRKEKTTEAETYIKAFIVDGVEKYLDYKAANRSDRYRIMTDFMFSDNEEVKAERKEFVTKLPEDRSARVSMYEKYTALKAKAKKNGEVIHKVRMYTIHDNISDENMTCLMIGIHDYDQKKMCDFYRSCLVINQKYMPKLFQTISEEIKDVSDNYHG